MISDAYEELKKRHKLPHFSDMDREFELCTIENEHNLLRSVKKKMDDRINYVISLLESILHPNTESIVDMYECRFFNDSDKKKVFELVRSMQFLLRCIDESNVVADDKRDADLVNEIWATWPALRDASLPFVRKLKEAWKQETSAKEHLNYLG